MLDGFRLIHMNGRIYDPMVGRFLSPDIVVQFPGFLQSHNRYSYILNNPLSGTDPSGQFVAAIACPFLKFAVGMAVVSAVIHTGNMIKASKAHEGVDFWGGLVRGYVQIALSAYLSHQIGGFFEESTPGWGTELLRATLHGANQGVAAEIGGGAFQDGYLGGFFGSLFTHSVNLPDTLQGLDLILTTLAGGTL